MTVREQIIDYLHADNRFFHHGKTVTDFFMSWEKGDKYQGGFLDLKKSHSGKTLAKAQNQIQELRDFIGYSLPPKSDI